jgi:FPC/CPF motif-containing protein YcgG
LRASASVLTNGLAVDTDKQTRNPFRSIDALEESNYCLFDGKRLVHPTGEAPSTMSVFVHDGFRALVLNDHFSCVGAKAAIRHGSYRFGLYSALGAAHSCAGLARDLFTFLQERHSLAGEFHTFVASFETPVPPDENTFEALLWTTLQELHDVDSTHHAWGKDHASDTSDPMFSFSFAETALFVVGLHAASSRATRRFAWPTLIFNPHDQFDALRQSGRYPRFQEVVRGAERALQGDINPMLAEFGERSEAPQYSGRQVDHEWRCPFQAHRRHDDGHREED